MPGARLGTPSSSRASATVAGRRPTSSVIWRALAIRSPLERAIVAVGQVEVVLQPHAHVAAQRERRGHQHPLLAADADHAPVVAALRAAGHLLGHVGEVARVGPHAAGHAHHAGDLQRLAQQAHVEQRVEVGHVPGVEALVLGPDAQLVHLGEERDDRVERVLEHGLEHEVLALARVLRVVHRAHVQRRHVRPELAQVLDPLLDRHADRAGRVVDDHVVHLGLDRLGDRPEVLDLVAGHAVGRAGVDVDHRAALVHDPPRLGRVLLRRVGDGRALVAVGDGAADRAGDHDGVLEAAHALSPVLGRSVLGARWGEGESVPHLLSCGRGFPGARGVPAGAEPGCRTARMHSDVAVDCDRWASGNSSWVPAAPEARLIPHTGITPCFFHGRSTRFVSAISSAPITTVRVSRGSITSSIIALPAAM